MPVERWDAHRKRLAAFAGNDAPLARSIAAALGRIEELEAERDAATALATDRGFRLGELTARARELGCEIERMKKLLEDAPWKFH